MSDTAPKPTGSNEAAIFVQESWNRTHGPLLKLRDSATIKWQRTPRGIFGKAIVPAVKGGSSIQGPFQIQSIEDDYVTAFAYDPDSETTSNSTPVYIAKEWKHRNSLTGEIIFGVQHNYSYQSGVNPPNGLNPADSGNVFRIDSYSGNTEVQRITPPWVYGADIGEVIYAKKANTGIQADDGTDISLLIDSRSCQWTRVNQ